MANPICPYCNKPSELLSGAEIYPHRPDLRHKPIYACVLCGAWVGCHPGTENPLGRLANAELRQLKMRAHAAFDPMWKEGRKKRGSSYAWLADQMGIPMQQCHIGEFNEDQCRRVIEVCATKEPGA